MRYMQIIEARDVHEAQRAYVELLQRNGIELMPSMNLYVETVHRSGGQPGSWLCYISLAMSTAA